MRKLMRANFARMWKAKIFWLGMAVLSGFGLLIVMTQYEDAVKFGIPFGESFRECIFSHIMLIGILSAVFVSLFIGTEYSDGTIRNKLMVGHLRTDIYLANFISSAAASILHLTAASAVVLGSGFLAFGKPEIEPGQYVKIYVTAALLSVSYSAVYGFISMQVSSKAYAAVINILTAMAFLMAASFLYNQLSQPETIMDYMYPMTDSMMAEGVPLEGKSIPNPHYVSGIRRAIYEFLYDFLPGCQTTQIVGEIGISTGRMIGMWIYSLINMVLFHIAGIWLFRKKDIK